MLLSSQIDAKKQQVGNMAHTSECPKMGYPRHFWPLKTIEPLDLGFPCSQHLQVPKPEPAMQFCDFLGFKQFHSPSPIHHHVYGLPTIPPSPVAYGFRQAATPIETPMAGSHKLGKLGSLRREPARGNGACRSPLFRKKVT